jgi:hypothetical protein
MPRVFSARESHFSTTTALSALIKLCVGACLQMNQLCRVCGEPAAGFHFGAFTCEGCKVSWSLERTNWEHLCDLDRLRHDVSCTTEISESTCVTLISWGTMSLAPRKYLRALVWPWSVEARCLEHHGNIWEHGRDLDRLRHDVSCTTEISESTGVTLIGWGTTSRAPRTYLKPLAWPCLVEELCYTPEGRGIHSQ